MTTPSFPSQIKNLILAKYHKSLKLTEKQFKTKLSVLEDRFRENALIVIPRTMISAEKQMELAGGQSYLNESFISDSFTEPQEPYLVFNIDDGKARRNTRPSTSLTNIEKDGRHGFTIAEGIALILHTAVLEDHYLDLVASRCRSTNWPDLCLDGGRPTLRASDGGAGVQWGAPSCRERSLNLGLSVSSVPSDLGLAGKVIKIEIEGKSYTAELKETTSL